MHGDFKTQKQSSSGIDTSPEAMWPHSTEGVRIQVFRNHSNMELVMVLPHRLHSEQNKETDGNDLSSILPVV